MPALWLLHRHIIAFPRFLDRRLLFCGIIASFLFTFVYLFILPFSNHNKPVEIKGITHINII